VDREGVGDPMSLHAGQPTTRGEKWVLSQWIRSKPINAYQTPRAPTELLPPEWYRDA
jgi:prolyl 4-hydroxylase